MRGDDPKPWKTSLILTTEQRDRLDVLATRVRRSAEYRPGASELIRALLDASLARLHRESFAGLDEVIGLRGAREAAPLVEQWLRERLSRCEACGATLAVGKPSDDS